MNRLLSTLSPIFYLRFFLGLMYLYSGIDLFRRPETWEGFIPEWLFNSLGSDANVALFIKIQGVGEFIIALLFLGWFLGKWAPKVAALVAAVEMVLILILSGIDSVTFRDIGLLGAALAIFFYYYNKNSEGRENL